MINNHSDIYIFITFLVLLILENCNAQTEAIEEKCDSICFVLRILNKLSRFS